MYSPSLYKWILLVQLIVFLALDWPSLLTVTMPFSCIQHYSTLSFYIAYIKFNHKYSVLGFWLKLDSSSQVYIVKYTTSLLLCYLPTPTFWYHFIPLFHTTYLKLCYKCLFSDFGPNFTTHWSYIGKCVIPSPLPFYCLYTPLFYITLCDHYLTHNTQPTLKCLIFRILSQ